MSQGVCTVCDILDGDKAQKDVVYCGMCDAWMCSRCLRDWARRAKAAAARAAAVFTKRVVE